jgi:fumarylacetoacetase
MNTISTLDETHNPARRSWVKGADGHSDFPVQNLPLGIFAPQNDDPRGGIAIGDFIVDLPALHATRLLCGEAGEAAAAARGPTLNDLLALGDGPRRALRRRLSELLSDDSFRGAVEPALHPASGCLLQLPCAIGDYTDFYVGIHHATNIGKQFRPDNPLLPNYKHIPIGYHGRASSVQPSGTPVHRPNGQTRLHDADAPSFGPSQRLDYELELGIWIGPGNKLGEPIPISHASKHIAGYSLFNDWSARDIQAWEYQPLGPFLSKNFVSTTSCWIITPEALAAFRVPQALRPGGDPSPLPYLLDPDDQRGGAIELELTVSLSTAAMRMQGLAPQRLSASNARYMYWTPAQLVAHHTCGGCNLRAGDLFGTGTISGPNQDGCGSMLEATRGGRAPVVLQTGEERRFLEDGDEVFLFARAQRVGFAPIGFGECRGIVRPGLSSSS